MFNNKVELNECIYTIYCAINHSKNGIHIQNRAIYEDCKIFDFVLVYL